MTPRDPVLRPVRVTKLGGGKVKMLGCEQEQEIVDRTQLIVPMLTRFITTDRGLAAASKANSSMNSAEAAPNCAHDVAQLNVVRGDV